MHDWQILLIFTLAYWLGGFLWIQATDPLAPDGLRRLWDIIFAVMKWTGLGLLLLALTGGTERKRD